MINLLPPQEKKELVKEEKYRLVLILGILSLFFLIFLFLVLLAVKINISGVAKIQRTLIESEEIKFMGAEAKDLEKEIKLINQNLLKLNTFYKNQPNFASLLEKISATLPEKTYLNTLSLTPVPKEERKFLVSLGGYSPDRELLFEFKKRLEAKAEFEEIYFPLSNWVKLKDINFSATFKFGL